MARLVNLGKRRPSGRARQRQKRGSPIKYMVRCIEFSLCFLVFGVLLLIALDASSHPHSRGAISLAVFASSCAFARVLYDLFGYLLRHRWLARLKMHAIDRMRGIEFEEVCAEIFRRNGFKVATTKSSGDQGADLVLEGRKERAVVQTKRYKGKVGNWAVQEVLAAKGFYAAQRALVVTNSSYSNSARELAAANGVELFDRSDLAKMLVRAGRGRWVKREQHCHHRPLESLRERSCHQS
jgi:HJR/Mrr/RecB family endonuclease